MDDVRKEALQFSLAIAELSAGTMTGYSPAEAAQVVLAVAGEVERYLNGSMIFPGRLEVREDEF